MILECFFCWQCLSVRHRMASFWG